VLTTRGKADATAKHLDRIARWLKKRGPATAVDTANAMARPVSSMTLTLRSYPDRFRVCGKVELRGGKTRELWEAVG
jgi:plasmid stabilization system protein ParE